MSWEKLPHNNRIKKRNKERKEGRKEAQPSSESPFPTLSKVLDGKVMDTCFCEAYVNLDTLLSTRKHELPFLFDRGFNVYDVKILRII